MSGETRAKVIGIGSPFGADRIGWRLVEALRTGDFPHVVFEQLDRPGAALLDHLDGVAHGVLIDAMQGGGAVGEVRALCLDEVIAQNRLLSSHGFGVGQCLALGQALGRLPPRLTIFGVEVGGAPDRLGAAELARIERQGVALIGAHLTEIESELSQ